MKPVTLSVIMLTALSLSLGCVGNRRNESLESRISRLVDQTTESKEAESQAFEKLESLGVQAVPYLVSHLGDLRPIAEQKIVFMNKSPDTFEGIRQYTPVTVHDALAAILNKITGQNFVFVYNGATLQERSKNRQEWVEWCRSAYPVQAKSCIGNAEKFHPIP